MTIKFLNRCLCISTIIVCLSLSPVHAKLVMWDTSHFTFGPEYVPSTSGGYYQALSLDLQVNNFEIQTTSSGFDAEDLTNVDVAVICAATSRYINYNAVEITALTNFVSAGGGLLVMADYDPASIYSYRSLLTAFDVTLGTVLFPDFVVDGLDSHPVFAGVNSLYMNYGVQLIPSNPNQGIAEYSTDNQTSTLVVSLTYGQGRVLVVGDASMWSVTETDYYHQPDNKTFAKNAFEYLAPTEIPEPVTMLLMAAGSLVVTRKRKR